MVVTYIYIYMNMLSVHQMGAGALLNIMDILEFQGLGKKEKHIYIYTATQIIETGLT